MTVALGDTVWLKGSDYWENDLDCSSWYGDFWMQFVLSNPEIVKPIILNEHIGLISVSKGEAKVELIGSISTRKDGEDVTVYESLGFMLTVTEEERATNLRPREIFDPFFFISDIEIYPNGINSNGKFEIEIKTNPDFQTFNTPIYGVRDGYYVTVIGDGEFNPENPENFGFYRNYSSQYFSFIWDSSFSTMYGFIEKENPNAWDGDNQVYEEGKNYFTAQFFGIKSTPIGVPLKERSFEVFAID